jgi:hypothetical protein
VEQAASHNSGRDNNANVSTWQQHQEIGGKTGREHQPLMLPRGTSAARRSARWDHAIHNGSAAALFIELQQNCKQSWLTWPAQHSHWRTIAMVGQAITLLEARRYS